MAKRRAEGTLLADSPSKRCCLSLCSVDMRLTSMASDGCVSPPSLQALLGNRCRKRSYYFDEPEQPQQEAPQNRKSAHCNTAIKHAATVQTSGSFLDRRHSIDIPNSKKRQRQDSVGSDTAIAKADVKAHADASTEDSSFNSFQYWRVPLPELDLSLLEDTGGQAKPKSDDNSCTNSFDAMET